jgi:hypothetical protein
MRVFINYYYYYYYYVSPNFVRVGRPAIIHKRT